MLPRFRLAFAAIAALALCVGSLRADATESLKKGTPELKSVGALAFGPDGVLFVGDAQGAAIYAIGTGDTKPAGTDAVNVEGIDGKIGSLLGIDAKKLKINDITVNPASGNIYASVTADGKPVLIRIDRKGKADEVSLKDVPFSKAEIPNASTKSRQEAITGLAFVKDRVFVAGLSNEDFASNLRAIPFPFKDADKGTNVEIYHGAHGRFETNAPVRTFVPYDIKGETNLLAAYTCTPLVRFPVSNLKVGEKVRGTTVAELGSGNRPLDMIVYTKDGKDYLLMANSKHGVIKVTTEGIDKVDPITAKVNGKAGLTYDSLKDLKGVEQLAKLDKDHAILLVKADSGSYDLKTINLP